jgi:RNA polymerase-binding transcription factor DksA
VQGELDDVERALQRLDDGIYGICDICGREIDSEQLETMPSARFCSEHQSTTT